MNWDQVQGQWKQLGGRIKEKWGKLTEDDVAATGGKRETLVGKLQERYGMIKEDAERALDEFIAGLGRDRDQPKPSRP